MANTTQKLTQVDVTPQIDPAGSGNERRVIDPQLRNSRGERIAPNSVSVSDGFHVASIDNNPLSATFGTFSVQNRLSIAAICFWQASFLHSIQKPTNQAQTGSFGPLGGAVLPPLAFSGGTGSYTDSLLPQYGNPIAVSTLQQALDANKRTIRTLVFRPNLPSSTPPAPNTFTQWAALYAAYQAQANAGACRIVFEQETLFGPPIVIPAGIWDFSYGDIFAGPSLGPPMSVELSDGCQIRNLFLFTDGLTLIGKTTGGPQMVWDQYLGTGAPTIPIFQNASALRNEGTAPMIVWSADSSVGDFLGIGLGFSSRFEEGNYEILQIDPPLGVGPSACQFFCQASSQIMRETIRGAGNVLCRFEVNAQGANLDLDQPNYAGIAPLSNPTTFLVKANRRIRFHEVATPLDNGATVNLQPSDFVLCAPSVDGGAAITLNLPLASHHPGVICGVKKINNDVNTVINVIPQGTETIEGVFVLTLPNLAPLEGVQVFSDGANWWVLP